MYWNEKIQIMQNKFSSVEFKDPFYNGAIIIKKIMSKFHNVKHFHQIDDKENFVINKNFIKECSVKNFYRNEMEKLEQSINYYLLLIDIPMGNGEKIYDCQKDALRYLLYLSSELEKQRFYILDKKYNWLNYFVRNNGTGTVKMYKYGNVNTIFD
jgi:hypothetical protein